MDLISLSLTSSPKKISEKFLFLFREMSTTAFHHNLPLVGLTFLSQWGGGGAVNNDRSKIYRIGLHQLISDSTNPGVSLKRSLNIFKVAERVIFHLGQMSPLSFHLMRRSQHCISNRPRHLF